MIKLTDVARLANVSIATASYVVNGKAAQRRISQATVDRVMRVVDEHRFQTDKGAAGLRSGHSRTLGLIVPDLENPSYARLAKLLEQRARARGYQLLIASSDDDPAIELQVVQVLRARRCDALIVASCLPAQEDTYSRLLETGLPIIGLDRELDRSRFCSVVSDDHQAAKTLTATLLNPVPRRVAFIGARPDLRISQQREAGFHAAMQQALGAQACVVQAAQFSRADAASKVHELLDTDGAPEAILTTAYVLLEGVFDVLRQRNALKPGSVRLATFGDAQLLDFMPIPVNAMSQQHSLMAEAVLSLALAAVERTDYQPGITSISRILNLRQPVEAEPV